MARRSIEALAVAKPDVGTLTAERAYYMAERRGFVAGHELDDWLAAEREVAALLAEPTPHEVAAVPLKGQSASRKKNGASTVKKIKLE